MTSSGTSADHSADSALPKNPPAQSVSQTSSGKSRMSPRVRQALRYIAIARPHHYGKNVIVLFGFVIAGLYHPGDMTGLTLLMLACGLASTCLIASSNYVLNEILDAPSDRFHHFKCDRPIAAGHITRKAAWCEWVLLGAAGMSTALHVGSSFFVAAVTFQLTSIFYNVPPLRLKDIPYVDVLTEAVNSPLRLLLGWLIVSPGDFPDAVLLLVFWMAGAFEMARKRLNEYRFLQDRTVATGYRKSFAHYDERRLKSSMLGYASLLLVFGIYEAWALLP